MAIVSCVPSVRVGPRKHWPSGGSKVFSPWSDAQKTDWREIAPRAMLNLLLGSELVLKTCRQKGK